ncbi:aconitate hydratase AcnA [Ehrlichia ruminantium]|uniref:aconitate hydratase AcnA n=1 Tax=Ehrlichia ruminantium TaxID=779 RepID=UPI0015DCB3FD|nr:aconitate hydratase AcnA [Ehrlichia ruminantium]QLK50881.1 aconitate hydratase AcnA [Ehrlichia ruminantium]QLK51803.1 aconitate hydratase AcnA [Ehrlichia ruminantium]QLK53642.1 aconitate hydratase AcnA [Ehrlichia ruminantium]QLK56395.1 aconitate hydratase AcnA [Ehrlichia ruminantium]UOD98687.1 aconitate hydratase AcnA [Ehrlichia ruminantium]
MGFLNSLDSKQKLNVGKNCYEYFSIGVASEKLGVDIKRLPCSLKILFENLLRNENGFSVKIEDIKKLAQCADKYVSYEINFTPARVLMQDFTGVPAVVDLAAMRDYVKENGGNPAIINPKVPVDLVIDHSIQVDSYGTESSFDENVSIEMQRNVERYKFLKWGQCAFKNFRVVPPGAGICHQVNLEYLAKVVWNDGDLVYPDTLVGTDSHTTMVNGLSVLGWGVGGIEAEAVMLGQPVTMLIPEVVGFKLVGKLSDGVTATDMVLTITNILRSKGVVGKFVEFFGEGLDSLSIADRATVANMSPEYGATCGFFPIDHKTLEYLEMTGRELSLIDLVESYAKAQYLWHTKEGLRYDNEIEFDLGEVRPVLAGPKRPQDKIFLSQVKTTLPSLGVKSTNDNKSAKSLKNGDIVIAAITSCTNTSNPSVMIAAGLVARKANMLNLKSKPWVKTSLAPGSQVVTEYLVKSGLQRHLDALGFYLVGYGCTTCIGNSGSLAPHIEEDIKSNDLLVAAVLSGNRNFEGRIHPCVRANFLASPPLVVAYALAGTIDIDLTSDPIAIGDNGENVYLSDIWPSNDEINEVIQNTINKQVFTSRYKNVFSGGKYWENLKCGDSDIYKWDMNSTYIQSPTYFKNLSSNLNSSDNINISNANILALLGDSVTTDHISPAGNIALNSPAGKFLLQNNVMVEDFNSYGSRRGNHHIMTRGTFANIRVRNEMVNAEGGVTRYIPTGEEMSIFDASQLYQQNNIPLVVIAGKEYGSGSSRDWAAKGTFFLNIKAIIAESFERIHRSNLIGMGVLPLTFKNGCTRKTLDLTGCEVISITGKIGINQELKCMILRQNGSSQSITVVCNLNTAIEVEYFKSGGVLQYVLMRMMAS